MSNKSTRCSFSLSLYGLVEENKRQDRMIEDLLRDGRDKSQRDAFNKGPKAEQGITTKLLTMSFQVSKKNHLRYSSQ